MAALLILLAAGCSASGPTYVDDGASYDAESVLRLPRRLNAGELADEGSDQSTRLRHEALVSLRRQGDGPAAAAELITRTFPANTAGVPFYVERASFESTPAWVVVEAIGRSGEKLADRRVWVLDDTGQILISGTR